MRKDLDWTPSVFKKMANTKVEKVGPRVKVDSNKDRFDFGERKTPYQEELEEIQRRTVASIRKLRLGDFGIELGKDTSLVNWARMIQRNVSYIDEGIRRNHYRGIREAIYWTFKDDTNDWKLPYPPHSKYDWRKVTARVRISLGDKVDMVFVYNCPSEQSFLAYARDRKFYRSVDDFQLREHYVEVNYEKVELGDCLDEQAFGLIRVSGDKVKKNLGHILQPENLCSQAVMTLDKIVQKQDSGGEEFEKVKQAIIEFATYQRQIPKTEKECFELTSLCERISIDFIVFCKKKFDLDIRLRYYDYDRNDKMAWREVGKFRVERSPGHVVCLWQNAIIDWSAKQIEEFIQTPYPFIYPVSQAYTLGLGSLKGAEHDQDTEDRVRYELRDVEGIQRD